MLHGVTRLVGHVVPLSKESAMKKICDIARGLVCDEQGMETVEWGVMAALIVAALVTAIATLGGNVLAKFNTLVTATT